MAVPPGASLLSRASADYQIKGLRERCRSASRVCVCKAFTYGKFLIYCGWVTSVPRDVDVYEAIFELEERYLRRTAQPRKSRGLPRGAARVSSNSARAWVIVSSSERACVTKGFSGARLLECGCVYVCTCIKRLPFEKSRHGEKEDKSARVRRLAGNYAGMLIPVLRVIESAPEIFY